MGAGDRSTGTASSWKIRIGFGASNYVDRIADDPTVRLVGPYSALEKAFLVGVDGTCAPCLSPLQKLLSQPRKSTN